MPLIRVTTTVRAPVERCFDLARDVDLHVESTSETEERAVGGVTSGLIAMGEEVTWEAKHFGIRQRLTSRVTAFDPPRHFRDSQVSGAFRRFDHDHFFRDVRGVTVMEDRFDYESPLGVIGHMADWLFLRKYMTLFLERRAAVIRMVAEGKHE